MDYKAMAEAIRKERRWIRDELARLGDMDARTEQWREYLFEPPPPDIYDFTWHKLPKT